MRFKHSIWSSLALSFALASLGATANAFQGEDPTKTALAEIAKLKWGRKIGLNGEVRPSETTPLPARRFLSSGMSQPERTFDGRCRWVPKPTAIQR